MADAKLTALTAASALAGEDLFYISQDGVSKSATHTQLLTLVGTEYVAKAGDTMTGALTISSDTLTASAPALNISQTWNNAAVAFSAFSVNIDNTANAEGSKFGVFTHSAGGFISLFSNGGIQVGNASNANFIDATGIYTGSALPLGFSSTASGDGAQDVRLYRDAAATLAQRNGTAAQTLRVYGTYTDSSNYERLSLSTTAGSGVTIAAETLGTGADNLDITLTPTGTGKVKFPSGSVDQFGNIVASSFYHSGSTMAFYSPGVRTRDTGEIAWSSTTTVAGSVDVAMHRASAGVLAIDNGTAGTYRDLLVRNVKTDPVAFASLVAAATAGTGARAMITNCSHATFGTAADGGGSTKVPVYSDGASWLVG